MRPGPADPGNPRRYIEGESLPIRKDIRSKSLRDNSSDTGLVNNAATEGSQGRIEDMDPEATRRMFEINN